MSNYVSGEFSGFAEAIRQEGGLFMGVQEPLFSGSDPVIVFTNPRTNHQLQVTDVIALPLAVRAALNKDNGGIMSLKEKLHQLYTTIDQIEKKGQMNSEGRNYKYTRSVDVLNAIRQKLIELRVYAEVNFQFEGAPFTIARAKAPTAPFMAVNVRCLVVFKDLDSEETSTGSGLGTGADTSDKAVYKAQTGALKYALKNAALAPDERAMDPEADPITNEDPGEMPAGELPDLEAAMNAPRHEPPSSKRPTPATQVPPSTEVAQPKPSVPSAASPAAPSNTTSAPSPSASTQPAPSTSVREPGDETELDQPPTEEEMNDFRARFAKLGNELATPQGKLKPSKGLPVNQKLLVFLLNRTGAANAKVITARQWTDFFVRVDAVVQNPEQGLVGLGKMINKINGVEDKQK